MRSDVPIAKAVLSLRPVNRKIDKLSFMGDASASEVRAVIRKDWVMELLNGKSHYNETD